jgi:hypothetical protein
MSLIPERTSLSFYDGLADDCTTLVCDPVVEQSLPFFGEFILSDKENGDTQHSMKKETSTVCLVGHTKETQHPLTETKCFRRP